MRSFFVLYCLTLPLVSFAQIDGDIDRPGLPNSITEYYQNLNLINAFSTTSEQASLVKFLENGNAKNEPLSKREYFVLQLIKKTNYKELTITSQMPNASGSKKHIRSRVIYELSNWNKSDGYIAVTVQTSKMSEFDNIKMINLFDAEIPDLDADSLPMPTTNFLATEVHKWVRMKNKWYKKDVKVVLTDKL